jgi:hypothetical protein
VKRVGDQALACPGEYG